LYSCVCVRVSKRVCVCVCVCVRARVYVYVCVRACVAVAVKSTHWPVRASCWVLICMQCIGVMHVVALQKLSKVIALVQVLGKVTTERPFEVFHLH
jgi:hypothetical protein